MTAPLRVDADGVLDGPRAITLERPIGPVDDRPAAANGVLEQVLARFPGATVLPAPGHRVSTIAVDPELAPAWAIVEPTQGWHAICCWPAPDRLLLVTVDAVGIHPAPVSRWAVIDYRYPDGGVRLHRAGLVERGLWFELHRYTDSLTVRLAPVDAASGTAAELMDGFLREVADHDSAGILMALAAVGMPCDGSLTPDDLAALADLDETFESMTMLAITPPAEIVPDLVELAAQQLGGGLGEVVRSVQRNRSSRPS